MRENKIALILIIYYIRFYEQCRLHCNTSLFPWNCALGKIGVSTGVILVQSLQRHGSSPGHQWYQQHRRTQDGGPPEHPLACARHWCLNDLGSQAGLIML